MNKCYKSRVRVELAVALAGAISLFAGTLQGVAQTGAENQDSISSVRESGATNSDQYDIFPRYDPSSSIRKSNPAPRGYISLPVDSVSGFAEWLRGYPLRSRKEPLTTYTGGFLASAAVIGGVIDMPTTSPGYDARGVLYPLMHEYTQVTQRELELNYRGMEDDSVSLLRYLTGSYSTNSFRTKLFWKERDGAPKALDEGILKRFTEFLRTLTSYKSLIRDCEEISVEDVLPTDLYIQTDSTYVSNTHLSIVLDVATVDGGVEKKDFASVLKDKNGKPYQRLVLFANSLTPASSFHIIRPIKPGKGNWFIPGELENKLKNIGPGKFYRLRYRFLR